MGLKMDGKSINQSQMDYVLCGYVLLLTLGDTEV